VVLVLVLTRICHAGRLTPATPDNAVTERPTKRASAAEVTGKIVEVAVKEKAITVDSGQLLFRLDDTPYKFALDRPPKRRCANLAGHRSHPSCSTVRALAENRTGRRTTSLTRALDVRQAAWPGRTQNRVPFRSRPDAKHALDTAQKQQELASRAQRRRSSST
jgi:multidrug resistance efflux pump